MRSEPRTTIFPMTMNLFVPTRLIVFSVILLLLFSCGKEIEDPYPPSSPQWIPKSEVEVWPERGIDAEPGDVIYLEWYPNPEPDIDGYALYRKAESDTLERFEQVAYLSISDPFQSSTSYRDEDALVTYQIERYDYYLRAKDTGGNLSPPGDTLDYALLIQLSSARMDPQSLTDTLNTEREFTWAYGYNIAMEDYVLTILDAQSQALIIRDAFQPTQYIGGTERWTFHPYWKVENGDSIWVDLQSGHTYQWRIDMQADYDGNIERTGSESNWCYFTVR